MIGIGAGVFLLFVVIMVAVSSSSGSRGHAYAGSAVAWSQYNKGVRKSHARREKPKHSSGCRTSHMFDATSHILQRRNRSTNHSHTTDKVKPCVSNNGDHICTTKYRTGRPSKGTTRLASEGTTKYNTGLASGRKSEKTKERMGKSSRKSRLSGKSKKSSNVLKVEAGSVKRHKHKKSSTAA